MKQYKLIQVALLAILLFGWAGCSQNEEEVPGNVRNGIVPVSYTHLADRLAAIVEQNLARPEFSIDEFAQLMKLGRTVFYRKLRGVTGYSPNEYLRVVRMKKAAELLLSEDNLTVAEVSYKVGISDPFYFSKCFKACLLYTSRCV